MAKIIRFPGGESRDPHMDQERLEARLDLNKFEALVRGMTALIDAMLPDQKAQFLKSRKSNSSLEAVRGYTKKDLVEWVNNSNPHDWSSRPLFFDAIISCVRDKLTKI